MWQFEQVVDGMAEACRTFGIPVTGGNVSFYNDTEGLSIHPTPVLGIVGILDDIRKAVSPGFKGAGDVVVLIGENREELGGSEYLRVVHNLEAGAPPTIDLVREKRHQEFCLDAIEAGLVRSAHDLSEGGLAVALAECVFHSRKKLGCSVALEDSIRPDTLLFGESQSRILVTCRRKDLDRLRELAREKGVPARAIGETGGAEIAVGHRGRELLRLPVEKAYRAWKDALPNFFEVRT
jgi:phosphoribosylformylglycinamidine synthase